MKTLIHGNDNISSRNYFVSQKTTESVSFDAENVNIVELAQVVKGSALFSGSNIILIDNVFSKKSIKNTENIAELLNQSEDVDVFLWSNKEVEAKNIRIFNNLDIKSFKVPQNLWNFLDSIRPKEHSNIFNFHKTLETVEVEIIFTMLVRQFRLLLGISSNSKSNIDEIKRLAPWQKSKLVRQATLFDINSLKKIYQKLYKIEKQSKTGKSKLSLSQNIDILLSDI